MMMMMILFYSHGCWNAGHNIQSSSIMSAIPGTLILGLS